MARRKSLKTILVDTVKELTEIDWERYDTKSRLDAIDDCANKLVKIVRNYHRRTVAAKKGN